MKLIVISGAPAAGKTSIAEKIAKKYGYILHSKDTYIEKLYDSNKSNNGFLWYDKRAKTIFFDSINKSILQYQSIVIESNFIKSDIDRLDAMTKNKNIQIFEIFCYTRGMLRLKRFILRNKDVHRHSVYSDDKFYMSTALECLLSYLGINWPYQPVKLSNNLYKLSTRDFSKINWAIIYQYIEKS